MELAKGEVTPAMRPAIEMGERLRADYGEMLQEHEQIRRSVSLREAAIAGNRPEFVRFADELKLHAQMEERVLYTPLPFWWVKRCGQCWRRPSDGSGGMELRVHAAGHRTLSSQPLMGCRGENVSPISSRIL